MLAHRMLAPGAARGASPRSPAGRPHIVAEIERRHAAPIGAKSYAEFRRLLRALAPPDAD
jgi:hypothetical protein